MQTISNGISELQVRGYSEEMPIIFGMSTVKPVQNGHSLKDQKLVFETNCRLMQVKSIAECSKRSILQYFPPALSCHLSLRSLFCLFLSGRFTQVLLYSKLPSRFDGPFLEVILNCISQDAWYP